jgi:putative transposase
MDFMYLEKGLVIERFGEELEFVARARDELYFESLASGQRTTLLEAAFWFELRGGGIKILKAISTPKQLITQSGADDSQNNALETALMRKDLSPKYLEEVERRLAYLTALAALDISKGQKNAIQRAIPEVAAALSDATPPSVSSIRRWWAGWDKSGRQSWAVISGNASRRPPVRLDDESENFVNECIDRFYLVLTRPSAISAYRKYLAELKRQNITRQDSQLKPLRAIGVRAFYLRIEKQPQYDVTLLRHGREVATRDFRMVTGHLPAKYPLDVVEIDHSPLNLYVLDDLAYLPLGRPWVTVIRDRHSGVLLGMYISFRQTGLGPTFGALRHSLLGHHWVRDLWPDIENDWPSFGRGLRYVSDRGLEFLSPQYKRAILSLGAMYELCPPRTPWLKASIERFFGTLEATLFESMPGKTFARYQLRDGYDPKKHTVIRFSVLVYLMHKWAMDYHNVMPNSRKKASPLEIWQEGVQLAPPMLPSNMNQLDVILGRHQHGRLSHEGVRFQYLNYGNNDLKELMRRIGPNKMVEFVVSDGDLGAIQVLNPITKGYFKVPCTRQEYANGLSLFQHKYLCGVARKDRGGDDHLTLDLLEGTRQTIGSVIAEEMDRNTNRRKKNLAAIAGINSNATLQGQRQTVRSPFPEQSPEPIAGGLIHRAPVTDVPRYTWGV